MKEVYILIYVSCTFKRIELIGVYPTEKRAFQMRSMCFTEYPDGYWFVEKCLKFIADAED
jgi:hypothetical protein